jgi:hypothetical protein
VASPDEVPTERVTCSVRPGALLECHADTTLDEVDCAPGEVCSNLSGEGRCVPPEAACPVNPNESLEIAQVCMGDRRVTCLNGNLFANAECEPGTLCRVVDGAASCVSTECLTNGSPMPGRAVCLDNGEPAVCTEGGTLQPQGPCPAEETCLDGACVPATSSAVDAGAMPERDSSPDPNDDAGAMGDGDAMLPDDDDDDDAAARSTERPTGKLPSSCSAVPGLRVTSPLWAVAVGVGAVARARRRREDPRR